MPVVLDEKGRVFGWSDVTHYSACALTMSTLPISPTTLLEPATLAKIALLEVFDRTGRKVHFGSLYEYEKAVIVFIRESSRLRTPNLNLCRHASQGISTVG